MALPAILAAAQLGLGAYQMYKGTQMGKTKNPGFTIPEEQKQALGIAKSLATQRQLPGQSIIEDKMRGSTAAGIDALKGVGMGGDSMQSMIDLFTNEQFGLRDLGIAAEEQWIAKQGTLANALENMSAWKDKKNDFEVRKPFEETMRASSMLKESAFQNLYGAGTSFADQKANQDAVNREQMITDYMLGGDTWRTGKKTTPKPINTTIQPINFKSPTMENYFPTTFKSSFGTQTNDPYMEALMKYFQYNPS